MAFAQKFNFGIKPEPQFMLLRILCVCFTEIAFSEAHVVDRIKQICFTAPVLSAKTSYVP